MRPPANQQAIDLAKAALARRDSLAGAGSEIMRAYGLDEKTARRLHGEEVARRKNGKAA